jgi:hypothetical protein
MCVDESPKMRADSAAPTACGCVAELHAVTWHTHTHTHTTMRTTAVQHHVRESQLQGGWRVWCPHLAGAQLALPAAQAPVGEGAAHLVWPHVMRDQVRVGAPAVVEALVGNLAHAGADHPSRAANQCTADRSHTPTWESPMPLLHIHARRTLCFQPKAIPAAPACQRALVRCCRRRSAHATPRCPVTGDPDRVLPKGKKFECVRTMFHPPGACLTERCGVDCVAQHPKKRRFPDAQHTPTSCLSVCLSAWAFP